MDLPSVRPSRRVKGSVWAVSVVKNEADVIVPVVENMFRQGVNGVLIADNGSTDDTQAQLRLLAERYPVHLAFDHEVAHFQGPKMDLLCDWARRAGADWIVPFDADEFWFAPDATIADYLRACNANIVKAAMHNLYPVAQIQFGQGAWRLDVTPHRLVKVAFRSHRWATLAEGSHRVDRPGPSSSGLRVLHVPWRSYEQFRSKGRQGSEAILGTGYDPVIGSHWRTLGALGDEASRETWDRIVRGLPVDGICWSPGGPFQLVDSSQWRTWDPDHVLTSTARFSS